MSIRPLGIRYAANLTPDLHCRLEALEEYPLPFVEKRLVEKGFCTHIQFGVLATEFKRFIALVMLCDPPLAIPNVLVDEIWHQLLLFTPQYTEFCMRVAGKFISHVPNTPHTPVPYSAVERFFNSYKHYFGEMPPEWTIPSFPPMVSPLHIASSRPEPLRWSGWIG